MPTWTAPIMGLVDLNMVKQTHKRRNNTTDLKQRMDVTEACANKVEQVQEIVQVQMKKSRCTK